MFTYRMNIILCCLLIIKVSVICVRANQTQAYLFPSIALKITVVLMMIITAQANVMHIISFDKISHLLYCILKIFGCLLYGKLFISCELLYSGILLTRILISIICDRPRQNEPYCAGYQSEIQAYLVAQGDFTFGIDR